MLDELNRLIQALTFWDPKKQRAVAVYNDLVRREGANNKASLGMNHQVQKELEGEIFVIIMDVLAFHGFQFVFEYDVQFTHVKGMGYGGASMTSREVFVFKKQPPHRVMGTGRSFGRKVPPSAPPQRAPPTAQPYVYHQQQPPPPQYQSKPDRTEW